MNLKTFFDGFAKVEEKCKSFRYNPNDIACFSGCPYSHACKWLHNFEAELRNELLPRVIDAITELVDDRSDFQKGYKKGYVDALIRVLGEEEET